MSSSSNRYTTPLALTSLFVLCGLPLRLDSYKGCAFNCRYCFARAREGSSGSAVKPADPNHLARVFKEVFGRGKVGRSLVRQFLQRRVPIHFGGMSDPFQPAERRYNVTLSYLRTLQEYAYPVAISTRGVLSAESPYLDLLAEMPNVVVQFSMSTTVDRYSGVFEEDLVRPSKILCAMERLRSRGVKVTCRWQPYVPGLSEDPRTYVESVAATGSCHLSFEFLKLGKERKERVASAFREYAGVDLYDIYRSFGGRYLGRELILPGQMRLPRILEVRDLARRYGMTFGAADNDFQFLSDTECCCSGVDRFPGFENWFRFQIGHAVRRCRGQRITFSSIAGEWVPEGSIDRYLNSMTRLSSRSGQVGTIPEHLARRWNFACKEGSPGYFYGIVNTGETEVDKTNVYDWSDEVRAVL